MQINYNKTSTQAPKVYDNPTTQYAYLIFNEQGTATHPGAKYQWFYDRAATPNSILPSTTFGNVVQASSYTTPTLSAPTVSNAIVDVGQKEVISATVTGGTQPFNAIFNVVNSVTTTKVQTVVQNTINSQSLSQSYTVASNEISNSPEEANIVAYDANPTAFNSVYSANFQVYNTLYSTALTTTNQILDPTQYATFTANVIGGAPSYTYNFLVYNAVGSLVGNYLVISSSNSVTYNFQLLSVYGSGADTANVIITDSATTNAQVTNSIGFTAENTLAVGIASNPVLSAKLDAGQTINFNALGSGGNVPYTYNFLLSNSITNIILVTNAPSGTSNSFAFNVPALLTGNTIEANVMITDSASTNEIANSVYIKTLTVYNTLISTKWVSLYPVIDVGQNQGYQAIWSGGAPLFTVNSIGYNTNGECIYHFTTGIAAQSFTTMNAVGGACVIGNAKTTVTFNAVVTDSATTNEIVYNSLQITVYPTLVSNTFTVSNSPLSIGEYQTLNAVISSGASPYTYNFVVYNALGVLVANMITPYIMGTSNTFSFQTNTIMQSGSYTANVYVSDSATQNALVSNTISFTVNNALGFNSILIASNPVTAGNTQTINTFIYNGLAPYTYNVQVYNSGGLVTNQLIVNSLTYNTFAYTQSSAWGTGTFTVNAYISDNEVTPETVNSVSTYTYTANAGIIANNAVLTFSASNVILDSGQWTTYKFKVTGGTGPFQVELYNITGSKQQGSNVVISAPGGTNSITFQTSSTAQGNVFQYNGIATDTGSATTFTSNSIVNTIIGGSDEYTITFNKAGTFAYVAEDGGNAVNVISTATNTVVNTIIVGNAPTQIAITPNGKTLYVTNNADGSVSIVNVSTNTVTATIAIAPLVNGVTINPAGTIAYIASSAGQTIYSLNISNNRVTQISITGLPPGNAGFGLMAINPTGTLLLLPASQQAQLIIYNLTANKTIGGIGITNPFGVAITPSGNLAYVTSPSKKTISVIMLSGSLSTSLINTISTAPVTPEGITLNPSGSIAYIGGTTTNNVIVLDTATNTIIGTVKIGGTLPEFPAFNPKGNLVYVGDAFGPTVTIIDTSYLLSVNQAPTLLLTPTVTVQSGQIATFNMTALNGTGRFTTVLNNASSGVVQIGNTVTNFPFLPQNSTSFVTLNNGQGNLQLYMHAVSTDLGTTTPYQFASALSTLIVGGGVGLGGTGGGGGGGGGSGGGGSTSTTTVTTTTTPFTTSIPGISTLTNIQGSLTALFGQVTTGKFQLFSFLNTPTFLQQTTTGQQIQAGLLSIQLPVIDYVLIASFILLIISYGIERKRKKGMPWSTLFGVIAVVLLVIIGAQFFYTAIFG